MAIVNQYKAVYPVKNTRFENEEIYINSTSMEKAVNLITTEKGTEPKIISKIHENVLTEPTSETTVDFEIKSYYIDKTTSEEIPIPNCIAYPPILSNCKRGDTVYMQAPNYSFEENENTINYTFEKWVYDDTEFTDNPQILTLTLDESISKITVKVIYNQEIVTP